MVVGRSLHTNLCRLYLVYIIFFFSSLLRMDCLATR